MKLKLILVILFLPFLAMAVQTNVFDNVLIRNNFQFTGGTPGANKVLTSDASGKYTPQSLGAGFGPFAVTNASNWYINSSTNFFGTKTAFGTNLWIVPSVANPDIYLSHIGANPSMLIDALGLGNQATYYLTLSTELAGYDFYWDLNTSGDAEINIGTRIGSLSVIDLAVGNMMNFTGNQITYGVNSSTAHIYNGSTFTYANPATINGGVLKIPASGGTLSNITAFTSINAVTGSNLVANTFDGNAYIKSGTNLTMIIDVNSAAGTLQTLALMTTRTNTLTGTPVVNTVFTNNSQRCEVNASVSLPTGVATSSAIALWTVSGSSTDIVSIVTSPLGTAGAVTNYVKAWVQPNGLYSFTNLTTGSGSPAIVLQNYREVRM